MFGMLNASCQKLVSCTEDSEAERNQFQGLQEHIDELTMEKFELKRGLEHQQSIAANLASENQKLLDDFNRQVILT